jgi:hypothetical protein
MEINSTPSTRVSLKRRHDAHNDETPRKQNSINDNDVAAGEAREELEVLLRDLKKSRNAKRFMKGGRRITILKTGPTIDSKRDVAGLHRRGRVLVGRSGGRFVQRENRPTGKPYRSPTHGA